MRFNSKPQLYDKSYCDHFDRCRAAPDLFAIIYFAVRAAVQPLIRAKRIELDLKSGLSFDAAIQKLKDFEALKKQKAEGRITNAAYQEALKNYLSI